MCRGFAGRDPDYPQRGAVVMIMLLILILGSAYFLLTVLNKGDPQQPGTVATAAELNAVTEALIGHALVTKCLPCPAVSVTNGMAQAACGASGAVAGYLPWVTLGLGELDTWSHRLRYVVQRELAGGTNCITASDTAGIPVQYRDSSGSTVPLTSTAALAVIAFGPNGFAARTETGAALPNPPGSHTDEITNRAMATNATGTFITRASTTEPSATGGPFDDLIGWVDYSDLTARLIAKYGPLPPP